MKRKVFSLMMLCLFAFLGMANAQQSGTINVTPDPIDLGYRPLGAWMRPFEVQFTTTSTTAQTITAIEADNAFFVLNANLPGTVSSTTPYNFTVVQGEGEAGPISAQLVAMTANRKAHIFDIMAVAYNPIEADVVETAPEISLPFTATVGEDIYDNYLLPGSTTDGKDVIYKMTIEDDILFNANVDGENGKIALYTEDFNGQPGPGADNSYTGLNTGGSGAAFEAMIGDENTTTSTGYFPFYTLYNFSISEQLYLATELMEAGMGTGMLGSLSFEAKNETGYEQKNISIWMANVSDAALTTTSYNTSGMTLVYTGDFTPAIGWNEFVFNQSPFAWDGSSNLLICVQRTNGNWNSTIQWKSHNPGFNALAYHYRDGSPYSMDSETYTVSTSSNTRANTLFKSVASRTDVTSSSIIADLTLTPGVYYLAASSTSDEFTVSADMDLLPLPEQASNPSPADGETGIANPAILSWEFGNYTTAYRVLLGTTYPPTQVVVDWTNELSNMLAVADLHNNKNYFWRVDEKNTTGITEGQIWGFTTTLNIPQNVIAANEKIYEGDVLELSWDQISDRSYRGYNVYKDGVKINNETITAPEYNVSGLTYNMTNGYTFNVTAVYDEGESDFSNDLKVFVTGNGTISGKVSEVDGTTGIAGVEITVEGVDEFMRPANYTFTTSGNGTFTGSILAGTYQAMAVKEGYQAKEYEGNIAITFNQTTSGVNFILDENWEPLGEVIAEEVDGNQVKVYWSQNIMSEIIEGFETGDLSAFDWVNDNTYPWVVTTTSPYEGQYCLKSGNDGVGGSTSSIQITMDISRNGLMSFYVKPSCENNWDFGYFYIDGVEKGSFTGAGNWNEKEFPITSGVHTFKWAYTKDNSVNSNDDCIYIDNISFVHDAAPAETGWISYDDGVNESAVGAGGSFYWGIAFPAAMMAQYDGFTLSKVKMYDYEAHTGKVMIYQGGESAPGTLVTEQNYTCTGSANYIEMTLSTPVTINPSQSLWIVMYNNNGSYPASCCANTGDPNGRWVSLDGEEWMDLIAAASSLNYSWQIQGYVTNRERTVALDTKEIAAPATNVVTGTPATSLSNLAADPNWVASGNRAFHHYNIYRSVCSDETGEAAEFLGSLNDTIYLDNDWASLEPGIYKWGVSRFYQGNRNRNKVTYDFENDLQGWTTIDNDGDGDTWEHMNSDGTVAHSGTGVATSASYINGYGALTPDNWLVSPQVTLGGTMTFWAAGQDPSWAQEHFAVYVSTSGTAVSNFTQVMNETVATGSMTQYTVDLSAYSGNGYVAIRHYNITDMFRLNVDDITLGEGGDDPNPPTPPTPPTPQGGGEITYTGVYGESGVMWSNCLENKMYVTTSITVLNNAAESPAGAQVAMYNISEPDLNMNYSVTLDETGYYVWENMRRGTYELTINQDGFEPVDDIVEIGDVNDLRYVLTEIIENVSGLYVSATGWALFGDIPAPVDPDIPPTPPTGGQWYQYDNGEYGTSIGLGGGQFSWAVMFPAGSYTGNQVTKVMAFDSGYPMTGDVTIYNGGSSEPGTAVGTMPITFTGAEDFVEFEFPNPVVIDPSQNLWVVLFNESGATYPAAGSPEVTSNPNGRWVEIPGYGWMDCADAGVAGYAWMIRAYVAGGAKGEVEEITVNHNYTNNGGKLAKVENPAIKSVEYYEVMLDGVIEGTTVNPFFQHDVENLVAGETYTTSVRKVYTSGVSDWTSFEWVYTPCDNYEGLQSADAEWSGDNVVLTWVLPEGGDTPPTPPTPTETITADFESGDLGDWTTIDADGDGLAWDAWTSSEMVAGHNGSNYTATSASYQGVALTPDNYLVSPQVTLGGTLHFWACAQDASWAAEHFGVAISTSGNTSGSDFTTIQEWTMSAKAGAPTSDTRDGNRVQGAWYEYTVDLSAYSGTGYVAIRHFNCTDWFRLNVDDITLTTSGGGDDPNPPTPPTGDDSFSFDFEGGMSGWTSIDVDGDGLNWNHSSNSITYSGYDYTALGHNGSNGFVYSQSFIDYDGSYDPNNFLISPQKYVITNGSTLTFWADNANDSYPDHFGVAVATADNPSPNDFQIVWEGGAKGGVAEKATLRHDNNRYENWRQHTVNLSAYAGQAVWIAFRHFNSYDYYEIWIDDVTLTPGNKGNREFAYDFESGISGWTTIDADGDGLNWNHSSQSVTYSGYDYTSYGHNGSNGFIYSQSFIDYDGSYDPNNFIISPQMYSLQAGSNMTFWADNANDSYPDHFGVAVATAANPTPNDFTIVWEGGAKASGEKAAVRHDNSRFNNWRQHTVDLSAYAGQTVWIAFRHFNSYDYYEIWIDDVVINAEGGDTPPTPPDDPTGETITADFESGDLGDWTTIDADGDGLAWNAWTSSEMVAGHNGSNYTATSASYQGVALTPDNYLVSPQVTLGGTLHFWACAQDASWAAEHFGVAISTSGNTSGSDFTTIQEWTMSAKTGAPTSDTRDGNRVQGAWYEYTVDLSAYSGTGYVAIRHFNCTDWFRLNVDDITLTAPGDGPVPPVPPTPGANVLGVEIFRNGEWIAEVAAPAQTYTDIAPEDVEFYEIRVVYNGNLEDYTHYTMSCPEMLIPAEVICIAPENLTGEYTYFNEDYFGALLTWTYDGQVITSENHYDNGEYGTSIGLGGGQFSWAVMFPAGSYEGAQVTKVSVYDSGYPMTGTVTIYNGGNSEPGTALGSMPVTFTGAEAFIDIEFTNPVAIDPSQNLWVVLFNESGATYPAAGSPEVTSNPNGRWVEIPGYGWMDCADAGVAGYSWMIRCYTSDLFYFQVFRNGQVIAEVPYSETETFTYFDQAAIGNYQYQVNAVSSECESEFAMTPDLSQDYVEVFVTSVTENIETRVYPNPTTGIVNIEANGMNHITVVNALGQIVLDTNISGDQYQMNLGQFKAGVYMVRITTEEGVSVKRVTVAK